MKLPPERRQAARLRRRLLDFYRAHARPLAWRQDRNPYRVLVSEFMLQQTTAAAVEPYYLRFLQRFPDIHSLAEAPEDAVLSAWAGLGYYSRARNLHRAASCIVREHGGRVPDAGEDLLRLPGIGPYTAGAVASIAHGRREPCLDGNVRRVLSRLGALAGGRQDEATLLETARRLVDGPHPGELNEALMELGATFCAPRRPDCPACPLSRSCAARRLGTPEAFPRPRKRAAMKHLSGALVVIQKGTGVLLRKRPPEGRMAGLWELPGITGYDGEAASPADIADASLRRACRAQLGVAVRLGRLLGEVRHTVLDRSVRIHVHAARLARCRDALPPDVQAHDPGRRLPPLTAASRKALRIAGRLPASPEEVGRDARMNP